MVAVRGDKQGDFPLASHLGFCRNPKGHVDLCQNHLVSCLVPETLSSADPEASPASENLLHGPCKPLWVSRGLDFSEILHSFIYLFVFTIFMYLRERTHARWSARWVGGGREADSRLSWERNRGLDPRTPGSRPERKAGPLSDIAMQVPSTLQFQNTKIPFNLKHSVIQNVILLLSFFFPETFCEKLGSVLPC